MEKADQALFFYLEGIVVTKEGDLIVADSSNHVLRKILLSREIPTVITIAGKAHSPGIADGHPLNKALLREPCGLALDKVGNIIISERIGGIRKLFSSGSDLVTIPVRHNLNRPESISIDEEGNIYVANSNDHNILKIGYDGVSTILAGFIPGKDQNIMHYSYKKWLCRRFIKYS